MIPPTARLHFRQACRDLSAKSLIAFCSYSESDEKKSIFFKKTSKRSPGHTECSSDNTADVFLPKLPVFLLLKLRTSQKKCFFFQKKILLRFFPCTREMQFVQPSWKTFVDFPKKKIGWKSNNNQKNMYFFQKRCSLSKCSPGHL